jgi:hypothetical protein
MEKLDNKIKEAKESEGFLITITTFNSKNKGKELNHWYMTNNFPNMDLEKSLEATKKLLASEMNIQKSTTFKGK